LKLDITWILGGDRTYEELKPVRVSRVGGDCDTRFDSTYEIETGSVDCHGNPGSVFSLDRAYEELKHVFLHVWLSRCRLVFIEPIRN